LKKAERNVANSRSRLTEGVFQADSAAQMCAQESNPKKRRRGPRYRQEGEPAEGFADDDLEVGSPKRQIKLFGAKYKVIWEHQMIKTGKFTRRCAANFSAETISQDLLPVRIFTAIWGKPWAEDKPPVGKTSSGAIKKIGWRRVYIAFFVFGLPDQASLSIESAKVQRIDQLTDREESFEAEGQNDIIFLSGRTPCFVEAAVRCTDASPLKVNFQLALSYQDWSKNIETSTPRFKCYQQRGNVRSLSHFDLFLATQMDSFEPNPIPKKHPVFNESTEKGTLFSIWQEPYISRETIPIRIIWPHMVQEKAIVAWESGVSKRKGLVRKRPTRTWFAAKVQALVVPQEDLLGILSRLNEPRPETVETGKPSSSSSASSSTNHSSPNFESYAFQHAHQNGAQHYLDSYASPSSTSSAWTTLQHADDQGQITPLVQGQMEYEQALPSRAILLHFYGRQEISSPNDDQGRMVPLNEGEPLQEAQGDSIQQSPAALAQRSYPSYVQPGYVTEWSLYDDRSSLTTWDYSLSSVSQPHSSWSPYPSSLRGVNMPNTAELINALQETRSAPQFAGRLARAEANPDLPDSKALSEQIQGHSTSVSSHRAMSLDTLRLDPSAFTPLIHQLTLQILMNLCQSNSWSIWNTLRVLIALLKCFPLLFGVDFPASYLPMIANLGFYAVDYYALRAAMHAERTENRQKRGRNLPDPNQFILADFMADFMASAIFLQTLRLYQSESFLIGMSIRACLVLFTIAVKLSRRSDQLRRAPKYFLIDGFISFGEEMLGRLIGTRGVVLIIESVPGLGGWKTAPSLAILAAVTVVAIHLLCQHLRLRNRYHFAGPLDTASATRSTV
jgi:hypothetical protein